MPPIHVHIDDPINSEKTEGGPQQNVNSEQPSSYPPARPAAAAVPAPTPYIPASKPPLQPTSTTQLPTDGPPPPQPGAVPTPPSMQPLPVAPTPSTLPPPPTAASSQPIAQPPTTTTPYQMNIPPPQQNYAANYATQPLQNPSRPGPTTLDLGPVNPSANAPPGGYQQNVYAQEMSSAQRASIEEQERQPGLAASLGLGGGGGDGILGGGGGGVGSNETVENAWNAVKTWANAAGSKLAETEEQIWKRINGEK